MKRNERKKTNVDDAILAQARVASPYTALVRLLVRWMPWPFQQRGDGSWRELAADGFWLALSGISVAAAFRGVPSVLVSLVVVIAALCWHAQHAATLRQEELLTRILRELTFVSRVADAAQPQPGNLAPVRGRAGAPLGW